jgi:hypothetical protein
MAAAIVLEDGSGVENSNCYFTTEELDAYYETHLYPPTFTDEDHKIKASIMACRMLDSSVQLKGGPVRYDQSMGFPRYGVRIPMDPALGGAASVITTGSENVRAGAAGEIPSDEVPKRYKEAAMELVRFIVAKDRDAQFDKPAVVREKIDVIEREFTKTGNAIDLIPEIVQRMVRPFVLSAEDQGAPGGGGVAQSFQLVRG